MTRYELQTCPYAEAVRENPAVVCTLHRGVVRGVLERLQPGAELVGFVPKPPDVAGCIVDVAGADPESAELMSDVTAASCPRTGRSRAAALAPGATRPSDVLTVFLAVGVAWILAAAACGVAYALGGPFELRWIALHFAFVGGHLPAGHRRSAVLRLRVPRHRAAEPQLRPSRADRLEPGDRLHRRRSVRTTSFPSPGSAGRCYSSACSSSMRSCEACDADRSSESRGPRAGIEPQLSSSDVERY